MAGSERIFISRAGADGAQAQWIAATLEAAGYDCVIQDREFRIGESFPGNMRDAFETCETVLAVMSPDYWQSPFCRDEWDAAYALDRGGKGRLIPVMLRESAVPKLAASLAYLDLARADEADRTARLVSAVDGIVRHAKALPDALAPSDDVIANSTFDTPHFAGREDELAAIHAALWSGQVTAVCGLGGTGKSALTREYAKRHGRRYAGVWQVRAGEAATLYEDVARLGERIGVKRRTGREGVDAAEAGIREAVRLAKQTGRPFLILLDNVERPARDIPGWLRQPELHVLASSRYAPWPGWAKKIEVLQLPDAAARTLLRETCQREDHPSLGRLASALGGLPLALVQAGAYLRENPSLSFDQYAGDLENRLGKAPDDWSREDKLVSVTFETSILHAEESAPGASDLLTAASLFAPDNIPVALLTDDPGSSETQIAVDALARFSLWRKGEAGPHGPTYSVHRLLMRVVRSKLGADELPGFVQAAAARLERCFTGETGDADSWRINAPLAPHAICLMQAAEPKALDASLLAVIGRTGQFYAVQANDHIDEAVQFYRRVLDINRQILGPDHLEVADSLRNLAYVLTLGQRFREAEEPWRKALAIRRANLEPDDPAVVECIECLALVMLSTERLEQAEPLYREALALREQWAGADNPELAVTLSSVALVLQMLGRVEEAEPLFRRAMAGYAALPGPAHPEFANACHAFGILLFNSYRAAEAAPLLERAVTESQLSLKPDDPRQQLWRQHHAFALHWLGAELANSGSVPEGIAVLEKARTVARGYFEEGEPLLAQIEFYLAAALHAHGVSIANAGGLDGGLSLLKSAEDLLRTADGEAVSRRLQIARDIEVFEAAKVEAGEGVAGVRETAAVPSLPVMQPARLELARREAATAPSRPGRLGAWLGFLAILALGAALFWTGVVDPFGWFAG